MRTASFRGRLIATVVALIGLWLVAPTAAEAHPSAGFVSAERGFASSPDLQAAELAGGGDDLGIGFHGMCCGSANVGCCPACALIPHEPAAAGARLAPAFASALGGPAVGLGPVKLRKPPRFAR